MDPRAGEGECSTRGDATSDPIPHHGHERGSDRGGIYTVLYPVEAMRGAVHIQREWAGGAGSGFLALLSFCGGGGGGRRGEERRGGGSVLGVFFGGGETKREKVGKRGRKRKRGKG